MSTEEFHRMTIPWKGQNGEITDEEVLLKTSLKFGEFGKILKNGGFNLETKSINDVQAFMVTLIQLAIHKAPFDHNRVENILALDTVVAMKIFSEALSALPLAELSQDLGITVPSSLQKTR